MAHFPDSRRFIRSSCCTLCMPRGCAAAILSVCRERPASAAQRPSFMAGLKKSPRKRVPRAPKHNAYPFGLSSDQIPVQAKMMAICDIFDALSASDRPYKGAIPTDRAPYILKHSVRDAEIDSELFHVFLNAQVYRRAAQAS